MSDDRPDSWERVPTEDYDGAAEALADMTGEPEEKFEYDGPLPDLSELTRYCAVCGEELGPADEWDDDHECEGNDE